MSRAQSNLPHSWSISSWPSEVWPHTVQKGRYFFRTNKNELIQEGVVARVGREVVFIGDRYHRYLQKRTSRVSGYECAANRPAHAS
jgi:hypothetical protein